MPDDITTQLTIPPNELRDFDSLMQDIANEHNKSLPQIVPQVARFFAQSAGAGTPVAKKWRKVESNPQRTGRGKNASGKKYRYRVFTQRQPPRWMYTDSKSRADNPGAKITRTGAARNVWRAMIGKMGKKGGVTGTPQAIAAGLKFSRVDIVKAPDAYQATLRNSLGYARIITPTILSDSMRKALTRMDTQMRKRKERQEAQWRT